MRGNQLFQVIIGCMYGVFFFLRPLPHLWLALFSFLIPKFLFSTQAGKGFVFIFYKYQLLDLFLNPLHEFQLYALYSNVFSFLKFLTISIKFLYFSFSSIINAFQTKYFSEFSSFSIFWSEMLPYSLVRILNFFLSKGY